MAAQTVNLSSYYSGANGKKGKELKTALYNIIGSPDVLDYGDLWSGFYKTDRMADNQVLDRYSNNKYYFSSKTSAAVSGMNKEHGVANSWWGKTKNAAYSDLHHLMPSDSEANNRKSNFGMGVVTNVTYTNNCIKVGKGTAGNNGTISLWEPADKWKGDFARSYFYVVTAYEELSLVQSEGANSMQANTYPKLQPWAYQLYLQWNKQDPVDDIERSRNDAVYSIQGNRNPFIDYPTLPEYIWGDSTTVAFDITKPHTWDGSGSGSTIDPTPGPTPEPSDSTLLIETDFTQSFGDFVAYTIEGNQSTIWTQSSAYGIVANAYNKGKVADDWVLSPVINLEAMEGATLVFEHATGYNKDNPASDMMEVLVTTDAEDVAGDQNIATAEWQNITVSWPAQGSKQFTSFESSGIVNLDAFAGQKIVLAFRYKSTEEKCWAWEIKHLSVKAKPLATGITTTMIVAPWQRIAVFDLQGRPLGNTLPSRHGTYIVVDSNGVHKVRI